MRRVAVVGVGMSAFGVRNDVTIQELVWEAVRESPRRFRSRAERHRVVCGRYGQHQGI
jgi:acetyl-CoA acetyltransferase